MGIEERLRAANRQEVTLPSGTRVRGVMPDIDYLVRKGLMSDDLLRAVATIEAADQETPGRQREPGEREAIARENLVEAAGWLRDAWDQDAGDWAPLTVTGDTIDDLFAPDDVTALVGIILGRSTPAQVTAAYQELAGEISAELGRRIQEEEAGATEAGWTRFPADGQRAEPGADGGTVRPAPLDDDRPAAPARRTRARPSPGAAPSAG